MENTLTALTVCSIAANVYEVWRGDVWRARISIEPGGYVNIMLGQLTRVEERDLPSIVAEYRS